MHLTLTNYRITSISEESAGTLYSPDCISVGLEPRVKQYPLSHGILPRKGCQSGIIVQFNNTYRFQLKNDRYHVWSIVDVKIFVSTNSVEDKKTKKKKPYTIISGYYIELSVEGNDPIRAQYHPDEIEADRAFAENERRKQAYIDKSWYKHS